MPLAHPSIRVDIRNPLHHLWRNHGTWWIHYVAPFDHRKRRIRRSLKTAEQGHYAKGDEESRDEINVLWEGDANE
jgi:hypothetical protein